MDILGGLNLGWVEMKNIQKLLLVMLLLVFPLRIREAVAQTTPSISEVKEALDVEDQKILEDLSPTETQQLNDQADLQLPKLEQNPFNKPNIDAILQREVNDDIWRLLRDGLPCLETSAACLRQLQEQAIAQSPLLKEIDYRIAEANEKINEARAKNQKSIQMAVLTPALQYILRPAPQPGYTQQRENRLIDHILGIIRGETGLINGLLRVVGIPFFNRNQSVNTEAQRQAVPIADIQVKVAELQRGRANLADEIKEKVTVSLVNFDEARTDFQTAQVLTSSAIEQFKVFEQRYVRGDYDTETYLLRQNELENTKAQTYRAWTKMRRALLEIKLLVQSKI